MPRKLTLLSIVVPVYNEQENIALLYGAIQVALADRWNREIIFIDDGSSDRTLIEIKNLAAHDDQVYFISFSRNFGHQNALRAGYELCTGDVVVTLDGDLQHPPALLPEMISKWQEGYEVVLTIRNELKELNWFKRKSSSLFYRLINRMAEIDLRKGAADFRLMDRKVVDSLNRFQEGGLLYRGLVSWVGFKQTSISYDPTSRLFGKSKYSLRKMLRLAFDGITSFSMLPLRLAAITGTIVSLVGFLYGFYALYVKFFTDHAVEGWVSVIAGICFFSGIQLIFLGLCGEYIGRTFMEVKHRPHYIIADSNIPSSAGERALGREGLC